MEIIMEDVLALLNIDVSYNERVSQINKILNQEENNCKELNLTVVSTTLNYDQNTYIITPSGLKNSKRDEKDGIVWFGYERKNNIKKENDNFNAENNIYSNDNGKNNINNTGLVDEFLLNDFVFPVEEKEENNGLYEFPNCEIY